MQFESFTYYLQKKQCLLRLICLTCIFFLAGSAYSAKDTAAAPVLRSRAYKSRHIPAKDAKQFLIDLKIDCEISELPHDVLIITSGNSTELLKASNILELVDSTRTFAIKTIDSIPTGRPLPENKQIAEKTGEIVIGTFAEPPGKTTLPTAIIDTHNQGLIIIAPVELIDGITAAIQPPKPPAPERTESAAKPDEPEIATAPQEKAAEIPDKPKEAPPAKKTEPAAKPDEQPQPLPETEPSPVVEPLDTVAVSIEQAKPLTDTTEPNIPPTGEKVAIETKQDKEDFFLGELLESLAEAEAKAAEEQAAKTKQKAEDLPEEPEPEQKPEEKTEEAPEPQPEQKPVQPLKQETKPEEKIPVAAEKDTVEMPQDEKLLNLLKALEAGSAAPQPKTEEPGESTEPAVKETPPKPDIPPRPKPVKPTRVLPKATEEDTEPSQEPTPPQPPIPQQKSHTDRLAEQIPDAEKVLDTVLILPEEVEMTALIELVGKQLKLNYMYDPRKLTGQKIVLKLHEGKIKVKDIYALLESVLKYKGFAMVRRDENLITIVPQAEAIKQDPTIRTTAEDVRPGDVVITTTFRLQHISTDTAVNLLKKMSLGQNIEPIAETNTLIVTGYAYRMDRIEQLLRMIDVPGKENTFQTRQLQYLLPSELAPKVKSLAAQLGTVQVTVSAAPEKPTTTKDPRTGRTRPSTTRTPSRPTTSPPAAAKKGVYLDTDDRTNRLLMIGTVEDIEAVNALIDTLDVPLFGLKTIKEYKIEYVEAADIVDALNELGVSKVTTSSKSRTPVATSRTRTPTQSRTTTTTTTAAPDQPQISIRQATNSLLVNATAEQHDAIATVIAHVDVEQTDARTIKEYEIKHVDTVEITDTLGELGIISQSSRTQRRDTSSRTPTSRTPSATSKTDTTRPTTLTTATGAEIASDEPQIATLEATNSLLINATPIQHAAIALVIAHVDRELDQITTPYVIYALENQDPTELSEVLTKLIQETVTQEGAKTTSTDKRIQTKTVSTPRSDEERIKIIPDPKTYSLIVYANKKNQQWVSALIEELDAYRPQVLLDVTLVNISKYDEFKYDLDLITKFPKLAAGGQMDYLTALIGNDGDNPTYFPSKRITEATAFSGSSGKGFYADEHIQALLTLVQKKQYGRVLARPKLLVNDNEKGTIQTKRETSVVSAKSDVVAVQGGGGTTGVSIQTQNYTSDITLDIEPHISKGNQLRLKINLNRTDFEGLDDKYLISLPSGDLTGPEPPDLVTSNVETVITVPDNSTIILGGLETITQAKDGTKIPLLGDIPIIGGLFRNISKTSDETRLYIFVKARILRPGSEYSGKSDVVKASRENRAVFEKYEKEMQEYEDWPGMEPEPMDPLKILEEDIDKEDTDEFNKRF